MINGRADWESMVPRVFRPVRLAVVTVSLTGLIVLSSALALSADVPAWPAALQAAVKSAVCARNGFDPSNVDITYHMIRVPESCGHASAFRIEIPEFDNGIGPLTVRAFCDSANTTIATVSVPLRVSVYARALVATRLLHRYDVLGPEDFKRERLEVTKRLDWVVTDADSVIGRRVLRTIGAGQALDRRALADVPLIRRGDRVTMTYAAGTVRASAPVIAMEDGYPDQRILVKYGERQRLIPATVIDAATVRPIRQ